MASHGSFDERAATWDDDPAKVDRARRVAGAIVQAVPDLSRRAVLEYGAGTGLLGFSLLPHVGSATLADVSSGMLEAAERKIRATGVSNVRAIRLDLVHDPLPEDRYGVVCTLLTMHHVPEVDRVLARFHDLLEPGGLLFVSDLDTEDGSFHGPGADVHHGFDREDLARRLTAAGFEVKGFTTPFAIEKNVDGKARTFPAFLATARRP